MQIMLNSDKRLSSLPVKWYTTLMLYFPSWRKVVLILFTVFWWWLWCLPAFRRVQVFIKCVGDTAFCLLFDEWSCYAISLVLWYKARLYTSKFIGTHIIIICGVTWNPDQVCLIISYQWSNFECTSGRNCALVSVIQWQNGTIVYHLVFIGPITSIACLPLFRVTVDPLNTTHVSVSNLSTQPSNFHKIYSPHYFICRRYLTLTKVMKMLGMHDHHLKRFKSYFYKTTLLYLHDQLKSEENWRRNVISLR